MQHPYIHHESDAFISRLLRRVVSIFARIDMYGLSLSRLAKRSPVERGNLKLNLPEERVLSSHSRYVSIDCVRLNDGALLTQLESAGVIADSSGERMGDSHGGFSRGYSVPEISPCFLVSCSRNSE